jgi:phosphoribosylformylglycinamidine synthase
LRLPINHYEGRYFATDEQLADMEANGQIVLRYCAADGALTPESNPNGSRLHVAGIANRAGNVFGLMPHPERAAERELGSDDGRYIFDSLMENMATLGKQAAGGRV